MVSAHANVRARSTPANAVRQAAERARIDATSIEQLEDSLTELAAHLNAAEYRFLVLLGEFDRRDGHLGAGIKSTAHWLNWKCGIQLGAARERVRVARALPDLPKIGEAFARGELSYSKVRAMTRVATPANEDYLLMIAQHGTASHLERLLRGFRRASRGEELALANEQYAQRELCCFYDDDGKPHRSWAFASRDGCVVHACTRRCARGRARGGPCRCGVGGGNGDGPIGRAGGLRQPAGGRAVADGRDRARP